MTTLSSIKDEITTILANYEEKKKDFNGERNYGLVFYTDGGCDQGATGDHGPAAAGVHAYLYDRDIGKTISYQPKQLSMTDGGYYDSDIISRKAADPENVKKTGHMATFSYLGFAGTTKLRKSVELQRVQPIAFFDCTSYLPKPTTNNRAELDGLMIGLNILTSLLDYVKHAHFRLDSRYTIDGFISNIELWQKGEWKTKTGDVKNVDMWKEIWALRTALVTKVHAEELTVSLEHVAAHTDFHGNILADTLTHKGRMAPHLTEAFVMLSAANEYGKASYTPNKLLAVPRWYYCTGDDKEIDGKHIYYVGRHGKEELDVALGSRMQEQSYAVVLTDDDPVLKTLRDAYEEDAKGYKEDVIWYTYLDQAFSASVYDDLHDQKLTFVRKDHLKYTAIGNRTIAVRAFPVNTAFVAFEEFKILERKLLEFKEGKLSSRHVLTDITDYIYGYKSGKGDTKTKITLPDTEPALKIKAKHCFKAGEEMEEHSVTLTRGLDIPRRSVFLGIMDDEPEVYILTWHDARRAFRYATLIKTSKGDYGIWTGAFNNVRYYPQSLKK